MESVERHRTENTHMDRSRMKDMVARNALESAVYHKMAKHIDHQKQAFVRQNTRDEEEMKNLLHRLQIEQQTTHSDEESISGDEEDLDFVDGCDMPKSPTPSSGRFDLDPESTANPYPVTIIPRFGGTPQPRQQFIGRPGSSRSFCRRKSVEYEDIQEALSTTKYGGFPTTSETPVSASNINIHDVDGKAIGDWLAHPNAISSVRRMRRSLSTRKVYRKQSNELNSSSDFSVSPSSSVSHSRNNSFKDRKRSNTISGTAMSPRPGGMSRRGGSLKEHRTRSDDKSNKQFSVQELNVRKDLGTSRSVSDPNFEGSKIKRKNSKKQTLQRKSSNESVTTSPSSSRKPSIRRRQEVSSGECSPVGSPLTRDSVFRY